MQEFRGQPLRVLVYVATLAVAAVLLAVALMLAGYGLEEPIAVIALASAAAIGERWAVTFSSTTVLSVYLLPTVIAAVVLGPLAAGVVAAASMLGDSEFWHPTQPERSPRLIWLTYTCISFITGAVIPIDGGMTATLA